MHYRYSTQLPNEIVDQYLPYLPVSQLKVLLVVIRQTIGWRDKKTGKPKRKDWISISLFSKKTGLTYKSVSIAIKELIEKELIVALDYHEQELHTSKDRRGKKRIFYAYAPHFKTLKRRTWVDTAADLLHFPPNTKPTHTKGTKLYSGKKVNSPTPVKCSDYHRYLEIQREQQNTNKRGNQGRGYKS